MRSGAGEKRRHAFWVVWLLTLCCLPISPACSQSRPLTAQEHYDRGMKLKDAGDLRGALREFQNSLKSAPNNAGAHFMAGVTHFEVGEWAAAAEELQAALQLKSGGMEIDEAAAHSYRGLALDNLGDKQGALREHAAAARIAPRVAAYHFNLGVLQEETGDPRAARQSYENALRIDAKNQDVLIRLGDSYALEGDTNKAIELLRRALALYAEKGIHDPGEQFARRRVAELEAKREPASQAGKP